jgi:pyridoxine 5-phosphate synthase
VTSDTGWKLDAADRALLPPAIRALREAGCRVILFLDPDPRMIPRVPGFDADGVEIYTGAYAAEFRARSGALHFQNTLAAARAARALGLRINIGHDLNLENLPPLMAELPPVAEASIGHELMADALLTGFPQAIRAYQAALRFTSPPAAFRPR